VFPIACQPPVTILPNPSSTAVDTVTTMATSGTLSRGASVHFLAREVPVDTEACSAVLTYACTPP
jgi:hypothetical protein